MKTPPSDGFHEKLTRAAELCEWCAYILKYGNFAFDEATCIGRGQWVHYGELEDVPLDCEAADVWNEGK